MRSASRVERAWLQALPGWVEETVVAWEPRAERVVARQLVRYRDLVLDERSGKIADRVAMLHKGVIQWEGPVADIETTDNEYVHQFVNGLPDGPIETLR